MNASIKPSEFRNQDFDSVIRKNSRIWVLALLINLLIVDLTYTYNDINFDELPLWPNKIALAIQQAVTYPTWLLTIYSFKTENLTVIPICLMFQLLRQ
jgi:hypothetical protein